MILNMQSYFHDKTKYDIRSNSEKIKELMKMYKEEIDNLEITIEK